MNSSRVKLDLKDTHENHLEIRDIDKLISKVNDLKKISKTNLTENPFVLVQRLVENLVQVVKHAPNKMITLESNYLVK